MAQNTNLCQKFNKFDELTVKKDIKIMKMQEQISKPDRQFIENFFVDGNFFSDTNEYLIEVLENRYVIETVEELPDSFNGLLSFQILNTL